jgi:hypothetical protein
VESAQNLVKLQAEKFDLLQPSGGRRSSQPASPALTASLKALEELKGVIAIHLKVSVQPPQYVAECGTPVCLHVCVCKVFDQSMGFSLLAPVVEAGVSVEAWQHCRSQQPGLLQGWV